MTGQGPDPLFGQAEGATPLDPDDAAGLKPSWVNTRADLNRAEQDNIIKARQWSARRRWSPPALLTPDMLATIHRRMFEDVWTWAGTWRARLTNIGVDPYLIQVQLRDLCADVLAQTGDRSCPWPADEIAARFHHRLVVIHAFPNGNGRHGRLVTDLLLGTLARPPFTWGETIQPAADGRRNYLNALRQADTVGDYTALLNFARQ